MTTISLSSPITQAAFGELVGISQQAVSDFVRVAALGPGVSAHDMLLAYCARLREQAAGRMGEEAGGLDLVQERAALARSQRIAQDLKNAVAAGEYAPIGLLADVLAAASAGMVARIDQLDGALRKAAPDLPEEARLVVLQVIAAARNEWIKSTAKLVDRQLEQLAALQEEDDVSEVDG